MRVYFGCVYHTLPGKIWNIWKRKGKRSYLTFWLAGNDMAPTTNKYRDFNPILTSNVLNDKCNLWCPKLKMQNRVHSRVSLRLTLLKIPGYPSLHCESMETSVCSVTAITQHMRPNMISLVYQHIYWFNKNSGNNPIAIFLQECRTSHE